MKYLQIFESFSGSSKDVTGPKDYETIQEVFGVSREDITRRSS